MWKHVYICLIVLLPGSVLVESGTVRAEDLEAPSVAESFPAMTNERLQQILQRIDPEFTGSPGLWQIQVENIPVRVITDTNADRMRIVAPIRKAEELSPQEMLRILQANYDTTLDARYAVGQGVLWSTFVHPLSSLTDRDFVSGLGQTVNIVLTYGKTYSSGTFTFGGGDSGEIIERQLIDELMKRGEVI